MPLSASATSDIATISSIHQPSSCCWSELCVTKQHHKPPTKGLWCAISIAHEACNRCCCACRPGSRAPRHVCVSNRRFLEVKPCSTVLKKLRCGTTCCLLCVHLVHACVHCGKLHAYACEALRCHGAACKLIYARPQATLGCCGPLVL
jgi:hypothetical protein